MAIYENIVAITYSISEQSIVHEGGHRRNAFALANTFLPNENISRSLNAK